MHNQFKNDANDDMEKCSSFDRALPQNVKELFDVDQKQTYKEINTNS